MLGGEDPLFIARRITRFATEDIGMADPGAVQQAVSAWDVYERLGSPDGELAIAQAVVCLATAPKSIAVYRGLRHAMREAKTTGLSMPPAHILNAPTRLRKDLGHGDGYKYDPDTNTGSPERTTSPRTWLEKRSTNRPITATNAPSPNDCGTGPNCAMATPPTPLPISTHTDPSPKGPMTGLPLPLLTPYAPGSRSRTPPLRGTLPPPHLAAVQPRATL
ncbi:hypothetical protein [Arthrobacter sp. STN4]|uniref:AAA family ATPase n=1 Tax=Arthrobacter sp. STN4 TaxID=2923276 RepID=UPI0035C1767A